MMQGGASGQKEGGRMGAGATSSHVTEYEKSPFSPDFSGCYEGIFVKVGRKGIFYVTIC